MGLDYKSLSQRLDEHFNSEENIEEIENYKKKIEFENNFYPRWAEKLHNLVESDRDLNEILDKIVAKYDSDKYRDYYWDKGQEPPEMLYDVIYEYAIKYGEEFDEGVYHVGHYLIEVVFGQGSAVIVTRYDGPKKSDIIKNIIETRLINEYEKYGKYIDKDEAGPDFFKVVATKVYLDLIHNYDLLKKDHEIY